MIMVSVELNSAYVLLGGGVFSILYAVFTALRYNVCLKNRLDNQKEPLDNAVTGFILGIVLLLFGVSIIKDSRNVAESDPAGWYEFKIEQADHGKQQ